MLFSYARMRLFTVRTLYYSINYTYKNVAKGLFNKNF